MVAIKPMPYTEKYARVLADMERDGYVRSFILQNLGQAVADEYAAEYAACMEPIPDGASEETKYELAYKNWMAGASAAFAFVRERMGEEGIDKMAEAGAQALIDQNANPVLLMLRLIRAVAPGTAFEMVGKKSAYEMQWLTDYSVDELTKQKAVFSVPRCKILDYPDTEDACLIGCQREYPVWLAKQLHVRMEAERSGNSCVLTMTPIQ